MTEIWVLGSGEIILIGEKFSILRTTPPNETYHTPGLIWTGLGFKPGFFAKKSAINRLNHGTV
jgi:hypothetical protein